LYASGWLKVLNQKWILKLCFIISVIQNSYKTIKKKYYRSRIVFFICLLVAWWSSFWGLGLKILLGSSFFWRYKGIISLISFHLNFFDQQKLFYFCWFFKFEGNYNITFIISTLVLINTNFFTFVGSIGFLAFFHIQIFFSFCFKASF